MKTERNHLIFLDNSFTQLAPRKVDQNTATEKSKLQPICEKEKKHSNNALYTGLFLGAISPFIEDLYFTHYTHLYGAVFSTFTQLSIGYFLTAISINALLDYKPFTSSKPLCALSTALNQMGLTTQTQSSKKNYKVIKSECESFIVHSLAFCVGLVQIIGALQSFSIGPLIEQRNRDDLLVGIYSYKTISFALSFFASLSLIRFFYNAIQPFPSFKPSEANLKSRSNKQTILSKLKHWSHSAPEIIKKLQLCSLVATSSLLALASIYKIYHLSCGYQLAQKLSWEQFKGVIYGDALAHLSTPKKTNLVWMSTHPDHDHENYESLISDLFDLMNPSLMSPELRYFYRNAHVQYYSIEKSADSDDILDKLNDAVKAFGRKINNFVFAGHGAAQFTDLFPFHFANKELYKKMSSYFSDHGSFILNSCLTGHPFYTGLFNSWNLAQSISYYIPKVRVFANHGRVVPNIDSKWLFQGKWLHLKSKSRDHYLKSTDRLFKWFLADFDADISGTSIFQGYSWKNRFQESKDFWTQLSVEKIKNLTPANFLSIDHIVGTIFALGLVFFV